MKAYLPLFPLCMGAALLGGAIAASAPTWAGEEAESAASEAASTAPQAESRYLLRIGGMS
jgi:hypothetical protein